MEWILFLCFGVLVWVIVSAWVGIIRDLEEDRKNEDGRKNEEDRKKD